MKDSLFRLVIGFCLLIPNAQAEVVTLYDGTGTPVDHGWTLNSGHGHLGGTVTETQTHGALDVETTGMQFHTYAYDTGYAEFMVSARIRVTHAQFNWADAGLRFSVLGTATFPDRFNGIYLAPDQVGFMDLGDMAPVAAEQYHDFTILYRNRELSFFVDDSFDSIMSGAAVPELYRLNPIPSAYANAVGVVQIGDQTNDPNINSRYRLESVKFLGITPVPEVGTSLMMSLGLALLALAATKNKSLDKRIQTRL